MWANNGPIFTFAIRSAEEDTLAGTIDIQLNGPALRSDQANLAYGLYPAARGRGFATRAVHLALDFLRPNRAIKSALIRVNPDNPRSAAVAMRAGFTLTMRAYDTDDGHDWYEREVH
jgi:RimJ/RimL family protein N-acetyltransferase